MTTPFVVAAAMNDQKVSVCILAADNNGAFRWLNEAGESAQGRSLAAAGRAEEGKKLSLFHMYVDAVQRGKVAELHDDVIEPYHSGSP